MKEIFGGFLEFETKGKLEEFINSMDETMAMKMIEIGLEYAASQGVFTLDENYCVYMALDKLKNKSK